MGGQINESLRGEVVEVAAGTKQSSLIIAAWVAFPEAVDVTFSENMGDSGASFSVYPHL
jgi:hypothetical protein